MCNKFTSASVLWCLALLQLASGQDAPTDTTPDSPGETVDSAQGSPSNDGDETGSSSTSLVNYYFVFLALILCIAGLAAFMIWRKRRKSLLQYANARNSALARDVSHWESTPGNTAWHRRYWPAPRRSQDYASREEGLNEFGEAPPAYAPPKSREEEEREALAAQEPAVPMHTLSREGAGLKPPDYTQATALPSENSAEAPRGSSSARPLDGDHGNSGEPSRT